MHCNAQQSGGYAIFLSLIMAQDVAIQVLQANLQQVEYYNYSLSLQ